MTEFFMGKHNTRLLTPDWEPTTEQSMDITKVQLDEPVSFIGVAYRNMNEELLSGAEITQTQLHHHQSSPKDDKQLTKLGA